MIKKLIKRLFHIAGYTLERSDPSTAMTMNGALHRCMLRGIKVNTVIDVGASDGSWTRDCLNYFSDAKYLLVEAQEPHRKSLENFCRDHKNVEYVLAAAGRKEGKVYFDNSALFGGLASESPLKGNAIEVPVIAIDEEVKRRQIKGPYLVKLDTHGFEIPILEGAEKSLKEASLVVIECYNFRLTESSLRYFEMCDYMRKLGFLSIEMVDFILRKKDGAFWQADIFFIPSGSNEFKSQSFD